MLTCRLQRHSATKEIGGTNKVSRKDVKAQRGRKKGAKGENVGRVGMCDEEDENGLRPILFGSLIAHGRGKAKQARAERAEWAGR
jgi:hypothetical protein